MAAWPLGLACVASATESAGHAVRLLDLLCHRIRCQPSMPRLPNRGPMIGVSVRNMTTSGWKEFIFFSGT